MHTTTARTRCLELAPVFLFFTSGATALIYEVFWSKYLALMLGSTTQAQTVVLAVFMGGLALGNRFFGHRAARSPQPLALYGYLEATIGLYAFAFYWLYQGADQVFVTLGARWLDQTGVLLALKGVLSVTLLLPPTVLMGGTLPVLAAWLESRHPDAARWSARFYSLNSCGAVTGAWFAGFFLLDWLGMVSSLQMTALVNVLVGFIAIGLSRAGAAGEAKTETASTVNTTPPERAGDGSAQLWLGCLLVAFTGGVSMGLEVLSSRALSMVVGASMPAFSIMLMSFILGIGLGSAVIASPRIRHWPRELTTYAMLLLAAGVLAGYVMAIGPGVDLYRWLRVGLARGEMGYRYQLVLNAMMAMTVLGLPAALLGSVVPLWIREGGNGHGNLAERVGRLLTWNTVGAVAGVTITGFVLMPWLGLRGALMFLAGLLTVAAAVLAWTRICAISTLIAVCATGAVVAGGLLGGEHWRHILSSGVFRARETEVDPRAMALRFQHMRLLFYEDAPDATVSVEQGDGLIVSDEFSLRINGKPDATSHGDLSTQYLLAHLPMLARPDSQDVFVLGFGSGVTAGALLGHPVQQIVVAENCAPVLRAASWFAPWNRGVLTNALTKVRREDARTVLKLSPQLYDVIISEPSNPWTAGIGGVFSREFFELAAGRLKEGGVMAQWFHLYEMNEGIVALVIRTFGSVFPWMEIWDASGGDIVLLGSKRPWESSPAIYDQVFARTLPKEDLARIGIRTPAELWARQLASQHTAYAIAGDGPMQSDEFPVLEHAAPKAFFIGAQSRWLFDFDERTWQWMLAPAEKREALAGLEADTLKRVFTDYLSVNTEMAAHIALRLRGGDRIPNLDRVLGQQSTPCIFKKVEPAMLPSEPPSELNPVEKRLWAADLALQAGPDRWQAAVDEIATVLRAQPVEANRRLTAASFGRHAAFAATAALGHADYPRAKQLIATGLQFDPASDKLRYLARIVERENTGAEP